jgi:hypothetical protein
MATTTTTFSPAAPASTVTRAATERVPWYVWCAVLGVTSAMIGGQWDISWHRSIGRDTFWTSAHMAIYLCGVLAGLSCGYLILATTFGNSSHLRDTSVKMWGFRGPLGAFIAAWGGVAMLTSAPFDNWWHAAYGLDVKIISPPHILLISGTLAVEVGTLILILGMMNRARDKFQARLDVLFQYIGGVILVVLMTMIMEFTSHVAMHNAMFYRVMCMFTPVVLAGVAWASGKRWAATTVAGVYTIVWGGMGWILPLFPAEPKLGPVYHQVTQFVPPSFPVLLIVPALALDIFWTRLRRLRIPEPGAAVGWAEIALKVAVCYGPVWVVLSWLQQVSPDSAIGAFAGMVTSFLPPEVSIIAIAAAIALGAWRGVKTWGPWTISAISAFLFLGLLMAVQWPFADFLQTPGARNWFFHTNIFEYFARPEWITMHYQFLPPDPPAVFWGDLSIGLLWGAVAVRLGLAWGGWMKRVVR